MKKRRTEPTEPQNPSLVVPRTQAADQIRKQIEKLSILITDAGNPEQAKATLEQFRKYNEELLSRIFDNNVIATEYHRAYLRGIAMRSSGAVSWTDRRPGRSRFDTLEPEVGNFQREVRVHVETLESILQRLELIPEVQGISNSTQDLGDSYPDTLSLLLPIFKRFHQLARQMRKRREGRTTLEVEDEYDVQDFLHVLLKLYFDDIRPEEWTPSYAGSNSRMDFLLKNEQTVIEAKKTRKGLADREVGEQLIVDIQKYRIHPDCRLLICFVYDPEGKIANPKALENDLSRLESDFRVAVIVEPK